MNPFRGPVKRRDDGFVLRLGDDGTALLLRLLGELRSLLTTDDESAQALTRRLYPVTHPDDPEMEAEYQRLMREELVASRLSSLDLVEAALTSGDRLDEAAMTAFARSLNSLRLVLGVMLGIDDDHTDDADDDDDSEPLDDGVDEALEGSPEHHLYDYLSWLLEHSIRALSGR